LLRGRVHPEGFSLKGIKGIGLIKIKGEGLVNDLVYTNTAQN